MNYITTLKKLFKLATTLFLFFYLANTALFAEGGSNTPIVTITPSTWSTAEGDSGYRTKVFHVQISECPNQKPVKIKVRTSNGNAQAGSDYLTLNQNITFQNSASCTTDYTVTVKVIGDTNFETPNTEDFYINLSDRGTNTDQSFTLGGSVTVTITDDDVSHDADLRVGKSNNRSNPNIGEQIIYTIRGINAGPEDSQIYINDTLPADLDYVSVSDDSSHFNCHYNPGTRKLVCQGSRNFSAGEDVFVTLTTTLNSNQHSGVDNTAHISSNNGVNDNDTNNNSSTSVIYPNRYDARASKHIQRTNGNWQTSRTAHVGDTIKYRVKVYNKGSQPTTLSLTDTLPSGVTLQSVSVSGVPNYSCSANIGQNKITCHGSYIFRDIDNFSGDKATILITALATQSGRYYNRARVTGDSTIRGIDRWSNRARLDTDLTGGDYLSKDKTVTAPTNPDGNYYVNDTVTFTLSGVNHGIDGKVRILDWLPPTGTGFKNGTTRSAFDYISVTNGAGAPMQCTFNINNHYIRCISNNVLPDNTPFTAFVKVRLKKAGNVCNRAYFYKTYEVSGTSTFFSKGHDQVCFDVLTPKQPPVLNIPDMSRTVDTFMGINLQPYTTDPDTPKANLIYTVSGLPTGLSMNTHGIISGTYTGAIGTYDINVTVTDEVGLSDSQVFTLTFTYPPIQAFDKGYRIPITTVLNANMITDNASITLPISFGGGVDTGVDINLTAVAPDPGSIPLNSWNADGTFQFTAPSTVLSMYGYLGLAYVGTYTITDKYGQTASATIAIVVYIPPIDATDDSYSVARNIPFTGNVITDNAGNGPDSGVGLHILSHTSPSHGVLTLNADGSFTYTPHLNYTGTDTFQYTLGDNFSQEDNATVSFVIGAEFGVGFTDFTLVNPPETRNIIGNYLVTGNTVECVTDKDGNESDPYAGTCVNGTANNNNRIVKYTDIDGNTSAEARKTWNSSSATFTLPSTYDANKSILWAGLYWQGAANNRATGNVQRRASKDYGAPYGYKTISSNEALDMQNIDANKVLVLIDGTPGTDSYTEIESDTFYNDLTQKIFGIETGGSYAAFKNVTTLLKDQNLSTGSHTITVANIVANEGRERNIGNYGGWSLVIIYPEDFVNGKLRNISIYNGYQALGYGGTTYVPEKEFTITGFKLPKEGDVNSRIAAFAGETEEIYGGTASVYDYMYIKDESNTTHVIPNGSLNNFDAAFTNITRPNVVNNAMANTNGIDIDTYDTSNVMEGIRDNDNTTSSIILGIVSRDENHPGVGGDQSDYITLSMVAFSAQLYLPKLCYDYSYQQNGIAFTEENNGSFAPRIVGDNLIPHDPVTVQLFVRNDEASDAILRDTVLAVSDINTTQAPRVTNKTYVTYPGSAYPLYIPDTSLATYSSSGFTGAPLGDIDSNDYIYLDYDLDPQTKIINMPINSSISFRLDLLTGVEYDITVPLDNLNACGTDMYTYKPEYGIFNVEDKALTNIAPGYYDLPTQIVKRVGDYAIRSYDINHTDTKRNITTMVAVELVDAGKFHDVNASCNQPSNFISPRVWMTFDNNSSETILDNTTLSDAITKGLTSDYINGSPILTNASDFYRNARENAAFRVSYNLNAEGTDIIQVDSIAAGTPGVFNYRILDLPDFANIDYGRGNNVCPNIHLPNPITTYCPSGLLSKHNLAVCMECIYGGSTALTCSRDNFSLRPKGFRIALSDENQTNPTQKTFVGDNNTSSTLNLAAGYKYAIDINATNFIDDTATPGYYINFSVSDSNRSATYKWENTAGHNTNCNDISDGNFSTSFNNGHASEDVNQDQVGKYNLSLNDKVYTKVDSTAAFMKHQVGTHYLTGTDCLVGSSLTQPTAIPTTISVQDLATVNGCLITSNIDSDSEYTDMLTRFYPYKFNMSSLTSTVGISDKNFIYNDSPSTDNQYNTNMSYNMNGTYFAAGYNDTQLTNFTNGCWADDTRFDLSYTYNVIPATPMYMSYSLKETNTTNSAIVYRPSAGPDDLEVGSATSFAMPVSIAQGKAYYNTSMKGAVTMDLGYNFNRDYNTTINPKFIHFQDFNITDLDQPATLYADGATDYKIDGHKLLDKNVTFLYGRAKPSQTLYDNVTGNSTTTPISILTYCDLGLVGCQARGLDLANAQTSEPNWWIVTNHNANAGDDDGNVSLNISPSADFTITNPFIRVPNGVDNSVRIDRNAGIALPATATIDLATPATNKWLIYNPNAAATLPTPFYRVRFIGSDNWAGYGKTGNVVGGTISKHKNRRLGW